jgi:DNA-binding GntR family transcriptional regulator
MIAINLLSVMTAEPLNHSVDLCPLQDADLVFEALDMAVTHVIGRLADPAATLQASQREMIEQHIRMQSDAELEGDRFAIRLLGGDFLVLLAVIHGNAVFTQLIDKMLTLYQHHLMPPTHAGAQRRLLDAILDHRCDDAVAIFRQSSLDFEQSLRRQAV